MTRVKIVVVRLLRKKTQRLKASHAVLLVQWLQTRCTWSVTRHISPRGAVSMLCTPSPSMFWCFVLVFERWQMNMMIYLVYYTCLCYSCFALGAHNICLFCEKLTCCVHKVVGRRGYMVLQNIILCPLMPHYYVRYFVPTVCMIAAQPLPNEVCLTK